jgi:uncharacterized protein (DUF2252 family)
MAEMRQGARGRDRSHAAPRRNLRRAAAPEARAAVPHATPAERAASGRAMRADVPRSTHADWAGARGRRDPVELLQEQAASRVEELVPVRYGRMLVSSFTFFRGAAYIMAADLAAGPRTGLHAQLCGDAHLSNFGAFAAPDRQLVFSVNDFDETLPGPFEWDLKRLVASFAVAGRDRGFDDKQRRAINLTVTRTYREAIASFAGMRTADVWYARLDMDAVSARLREFATPKQIRRFDANIEKAQSRDNLKAFSKLTGMVDGEPRILSDPPLIAPVEDLMDAEDHARIDEQAREIVRAYCGTLSDDCRRLIERFRYIHAARKVVGVGSVGTRAWIMLLLGRDGDDPLLLQFKEAQPSVLEPFLGGSGFDNHGRRVVEGQRLMQAASDILLGWIRTTGLDGAERDFYVRQLWDSKGSALIEAMKPSAMEIYAHMCSWTLARAHARSGDPIAIASYLGSGDAFDRALASFAERYADQNERDYAALQDAVASGRIAAETGI